MIVGPYSGYAYLAVLNKARVDVQIVPIGGGRYAFQAAALPVTLTGATNTIPVTLVIGNDTETTTVSPLILRR